VGSWEKQIIERLPYGEGFLFVDTLHKVSEESIEGSYIFKDEEFFYEHHFPGQPVTPGVILIECMAQIGLVSLGLYLERERWDRSKFIVLFTDAEVNFRKIVPRGTSVIVKSKKKYYRMGKLKVDVSMWNKEGDRIAEGSLAGMVKKEEK